MSDFLRTGVRGSCELREPEPGASARIVFTVLAAGQLLQLQTFPFRLGSPFLEPSLKVSLEFPASGYGETRTHILGGLWERFSSAPMSCKVFGEIVFSGSGVLMQPHQQL